MENVSKNPEAEERGVNVIREFAVVVAAARITLSGNHIHAKGIDKDLNVIDAYKKITGNKTYDMPEKNDKLACYQFYNKKGELRTFFN